MRDNFGRSVPSSSPQSPSGSSFHGVALIEKRFRGLRSTKRSMTKVLTKVLTRWLVTVALVIGIYVVLSEYEKYPVMSRSTKREFNALITGLSITLSISIIGFLDSMVADLRWWILSRRPRSIKKIDLILQSEGIVSGILLARITRRSSIHLAVVLWVTVTLASQVALAMVGLCYSVNTANKSALLSTNGNITIPDMSTIQMSTVIKSNSSSLRAQQYASNSYGFLSLAFTTNDTSNLPQKGDLWEAGDPLTFCNYGSKIHCDYVFQEKSNGLPTNANLDAVVATTRKVNATTVCKSMPVKEGGNGTETTIVVSGQYSDETIRIPYQGGVEQTIYMTNVTYDCGAGCSTITAFEVSPEDPWYYTCNCTIGTTLNATLPEHEVGLSLRSLASAAIALQGYDATSSSNDPVVQYKSYPAESVFGYPVRGNVTNMELLISRFAIGVVALAAQTNPTLVVSGSVPTLGTQIDVEHWRYLHIILLSLTSLQLILGVMAAVVANRVVIPRGGSIAIGQVFKPMMSHDLLSKGTVTGLGEGARGSSRWIYRDKLVSEADGTYDLYMEECGNAGARPDDIIELTTR